MGGSITDGRSRELLLKEIEELRSCLRESEQALEAIRTGDVDALVVQGPFGEQVFSLTGSDRIYRTIVETMNEAALTVSPEGIVLFCNPRFSDLLKRPMHEVIGKKLVDFVAVSNRTSLQDFLAQTQTEPSRKRLMLHSAKGNEFPVQFSSTPLAAESGLSLCIVVTDLTDSEAAVDFIRFLEEHQKELIASREQLSLAKDSAGIGFYDNDLRAGRKVWDERVRQLLELEKDLPATDEHFWSKVHPDDHAMVKAALARAFDSRGSGEYLAEYRIVVTGNVTQRWVNSRGCVYFEGGKPVRFIGGMQDITDRKRAEKKLRQSEQKYRSLFQNIDELVSVYQVERDESGRIVEHRLRDANRAFLHALGISSADEILGKTFSEILGKVWSEQHLAAVQKAMDTGEVQVQEVFRPESGRHYITSAVRLGADTYLGTWRDITERHQAETLLRESAERYAAIHDHAPFAIALFRSPDGVIAEVNEAFERLFACPREKAIGKTTVELGIASDPELRAKMYQEIQQNGFVRDWEMPYRKLTGEERLASLNFDLIDIGGVKYHLGSAIDITARKQAEEGLAAAHRQIQNIIDNTPDIVYAFDLDNRFVMVNTTLAALLNSTPEQLIGKRRHEFMPKEDADWHDSHDRKVIESGRMLEFEEYSHLESRSITWLTKKFPLRDAQGNLCGVAGISADISDRKRAEEELRRLNETLENKVMERTSALQAANRVLEQRASQLRELAGKLTTTEHRERQRLAKILHDGLQQYLVAVKIQLSGLASRQEGNPIRESLYELDNLLNDAVQVSRNLAAELSPPILQDAGIVPALEWLSRWNHQKHGLKVNVVRDMEAPLLSDEIKVLVFESVRELLLNVVKHSGAKEAEIRLCQTIENKLQVTVSDSGAGYDTGRMTACAIPDHGGLGLFSIRERIQIIGGEFKADSTPDRGSRFVLTVPMTIIVTQKVVQPDQSHCTPIASAGQNRKIRILLTDDHAVMREGLARLLSQEPDMEIVGQAADGQEAVEMAERIQPDIILMDLSMPRLNGIEATKIIHQKHPEIRIIGLSLYTADERAKEMIEAGAARYLGKAGAPSELKASIRACYRKDRSSDNARSIQ